MNDAGAGRGERFAEKLLSGPMKGVLGIMRRNLGAAVGLKLLSMVLQFSLFPMLIHELGKAEYGVWVVLQSTIFWFTLLDLGVGMGLRNKLIESLNLDQSQRARGYLSSAMVGQALVWIGASLCVGFILFGLGIEWSQWFRSTTSDQALAVAIFLSFIALAWNQCLGVTNAILIAKHWNGLTSVVSVSATLAMLFYVIAARRLEWELSLPRLALVNLMTYVVAHCLQAWYVFRRCPELFPRFSEYRFGVYREVLLLGGQFLVLELTYLLIFMTDRMIALRYLGPEVATEYDIVLRFVGLVTTGYSMVIGPMWSLAGASWAKRDLVGLRMLRRIVLWVMIPFWIGAVVLALVMNELIRRWIDPTISLDRSMLVLVVIYAWTVIWCGAHASLLNGIGRVREQMICGVLACFINVPLAIYLCGFESLGGGGILLASIVSLSLFGVVGPLVWRDCQRGLES